MNINEAKYYQFPNKIIMKKFALMILVIGLVGVFSGVASGQTFQDGKEAYDRKDYRRAFEILKPLAEQGHAEAQYTLGVMYDEGEGVKEDDKEAVKWFRLSAEQGDVKAQFDLADMYRTGDGVIIFSSESLSFIDFASPFALAMFAHLCACV